MYRSSQELFDSHLVKSRTHEEAGEWSLAIRELREALRLRPRSSGARDDLERLKTMLTPPKQCEAISGDRLSASFNLSIRYWDQNMPSVALKEILERLGLPCTCIDHNVDVINDIVRSTRNRELLLREAVGGKKKNNLPLNYDLAILYYDRRMLTVASSSLLRCRELASTVCDAIESKFSVHRASLDVPSSRTPIGGQFTDEESVSYMANRVRAQSRLRGIQDDIDHVKELQSVFATSSGDVPVLPCLLSRFTDQVTQCEDWWKTIRSSPLIAWSN